MISEVARLLPHSEEPGPDRGQAHDDYAEAGDTIAREFSARKGRGENEWKSKAVDEGTAMGRRVRSASTCTWRHGSATGK